MEKDNPPFNRGNRVYLNSAPDTLLTVEHCVWNYRGEDEWWVIMVYWDEPTRAFKKFAAFASMLTKDDSSPPEETKPLGYHP